MHGSSRLVNLQNNYASRTYPESPTWKRKSRTSSGIFASHENLDHGDALGVPMTDEQANTEKITELIVHPPQVTLTRRDVVWRIVAIVTGFLSAASLVIALIAAAKGQQTSACINNILGSRAATSAKDSQANQAIANANRDFTIALNQVFAAPQGSAQQQSAFLNFESVSVKAAAALGQASDQLAADDAFRQSHPLGHC